MTSTGPRRSTGRCSAGSSRRIPGRRCPIWSPRRRERPRRPRGDHPQARYRQGAHADDRCRDIDQAMIEVAMNGGQQGRSRRSPDSAASATPSTPRATSSRFSSGLADAPSPPTRFCVWGGLRQPVAWSVRRRPHHEPLSCARRRRGSVRPRHAPGAWRLALPPTAAGFRACRRPDRDGRETLRPKSVSRRAGRLGEHRDRRNRPRQCHRPRPARPGTTVNVVLGLQMRNPDAAKSAIAAGQQMSRSAFVSQYAPSPAQVSAAVAYLRAQGFTNVTATPNDMLVTASASAAASRRRSTPRSTPSA